VRQVCSSVVTDSSRNRVSFVSDTLLIPVINEAKVGDVLLQRQLLMNLERALGFV